MLTRISLMACTCVMSKPRVVIVPGNGCSPVRSSNWYVQAQEDMIRSGLFSEVVLKDMPDPLDAKESLWLPFIETDLRCDANTIVVGHSSGAVACLRFLETHRLLGCVLFSVSYTDLGNEDERASGYYNRPWDWNRIRSNSGFILQYHSEDDPFIPKYEANHVAASLGLTSGDDYVCYKDRSHFFSPKDVNHLTSAIASKLK